MQTPKARTSEVPQKASPRVARRLRTSHSDTPDSSSSSSSIRMGKELSPKVSERRAPLSPGVDRRRAVKSYEMENQILRLREELKVAREDLLRSEVMKKQALEDVEEMKRKMAEMEMNALNELSVEEGQKSEDTYQRFSVDSSELCTALGEIQLLRSQVKAAIKSEADARVACESANSELECLRERFADTVSVIETMKIHLIESTQSDYVARSFMNDAIVQLEEIKTLEKSEESREFEFKTLEKSEESGYFEVGKKVEIVEEDEELQKVKATVEGLKAELMDKETELQGILEENEKHEVDLSSQRIKNTELADGLKRSQETNEDLRGKLLTKDEELRGIHDEIEILKKRLERAEEEESKRKSEAEVKLGLIREEAERNSGKVARLAEQLEAAQAAGSELETELRRLKVQSDQWRKAAEAAAAMLAAGTERKVDGQYSPVRGNGSPYNDDLDEDVRKRNGSVLKKIGVLWKKPHK